MSERSKVARSVPRFDAMSGFRLELLIASCAQNILALAMPITILQVYDRIVPNQSMNTLGVFVSALAVVLLLDFLLSIGRFYITGWTGARFQHAISCRSIEHIFRSDLRAFEADPPGVHLQRLRGSDSLKSFFAGQGLLLLVDLPFAFLFFALIGLIAGPLVMVPVAVMILLAITGGIAGRKLRDALEARRRTDDRRYNFMIEVLTAIRTVKGLGMETLMVRRYERLQASSAEASYSVSEGGTWARATGQMFSQLTAICIAAYGSTLVIEGNLTIGGLAACTLLASRSAQPMMRALGTWTQFQNARVSRNQVTSVFSLPLESGPEAPAIHSIRGNVKLEELSFSYTGFDQSIFRDVNLELAEGETIAISGVNGSGKSTLLGLMMGLLVPSSGRVLIDGENIWDYDAVSLRSQVVYLPQKPVLFQGTILDNMTMFRGDAYVDATLQMAERLGLHDAVSRMPRGYDTPIEHAANDGLPGGVRQRIALVRALTLVDDPRLILFDEANTFLDQKSDALLLDLLRERKGKCAMAIVSHRPSFLALADRSYQIRGNALHEIVNGPRASIERLEKEYA
jgi:ATP-binding cassette subfamily C protein LapB